MADRVHLSSPTSNYLVTSSIPALTDMQVTLLIDKIAREADNSSPTPKTLRWDSQGGIDFTSRTDGQELTEPEAISLLQRAAPLFSTDWSTLRAASDVLSSRYPSLR